MDGYFYEPEYNTQWERYLWSNLHNHLRNLPDCIGLNRVTTEFEQQFLKRTAEDASKVPFEALYNLIESLAAGRPHYT